jgi:hypothetical protein
VDSTSFDNDAGERFVYDEEHNEIALGCAITRKAIDDNLYKTQFHPSNLGLIEFFPADQGDLRREHPEHGDHLQRQHRR